MSDESQFNKARAAAQRALEAHESTAMANAVGLVDLLRITIIARMAESHLKANDVAGFRTLSMMVDSALNDFQSRMSQQLRDDIQVGVDAAVAIVDKPLAAIGVSPSLLPLNPASVEAAQLFALDRVKGLTADARDAIAGILRRVLGNAISVDQGIKEVGTSLRTDGVMKGIAKRAALIVRQEILTVQSQVAQQRMEHRAKQMVGGRYELRKAWLTANDQRVRDAHADAQDAYAKDADPGPIAIDESFIVDDEELLYPRYPGGSLDNILGCRCTTQPVLVLAA